MPDLHSGVPGSNPGRSTKFFRNKMSKLEKAMQKHTGHALVDWQGLLESFIGMVGPDKMKKIIDDDFSGTVQDKCEKIIIDPYFNQVLTANGIALNLNIEEEPEISFKTFAMDKFNENVGTETYINPIGSDPFADYEKARNDRLEQAKITGQAVENPVTVGNLIEHLKQFPEDMPVVFAGEEQGSYYAFEMEWAYPCNVYAPEGGTDLGDDYYQDPDADEDNSFKALILSI